MTTSRHHHGCAFCTSLQRWAIRRRDAALLDATLRLRDMHTANDAEREAFARGPICMSTPALATAEQRQAIPGR